MTEKAAALGESRPPGIPADRAAEDRVRLTGCMTQVARSKDRAAYAEIFRFYAPRVKAFLMRGGASAHEADELAQDVMVTVWQRAETFDERQASASTWIFTIARNRRIDSIRRQRRPEIDPNDPMFVPDPEPAPDDAAIAASREERLRAAIKGLPEEQRTLLRQAFFESKSHSEIAAESGLPLGTVKSRLRLAFGRLRRALDGEV
jgi:RNA polymerase sigma-70 factor (ECF subfamily)